MFPVMAEIPLDRQEIGQRIRKAREESGISAGTLAIAFDRTSKAYYHWENGVAMPTADQLKELCRMLDVSADLILTGVSSWPYELFSPGGYAILPDAEKQSIEDSIAGAIQRHRRKQTRHVA